MKLLFWQKVNDEFKFSNCTKVMSFSHGKKVYTKESEDGKMIPLYVEILHPHDLFELDNFPDDAESHGNRGRDVIKKRMCDMFAKNLSKLGVRGDSGLFQYLKLTVEQYVDSYKPPESLPTLGNGEQSPEKEELTYQTAYPELRDIITDYANTEEQYIRLSSGCDHHVAKYGDEIHIEAEPNLNLQGYDETNFKENKISTRLNLTICRLNDDTAYDILVSGECIAMYISYKYLGKEDERDNPSHHGFDPAKVIADEKVIDERSGTKLTRYIRGCGFAFKGYRFDEGFKYLVKARRVSSEVDLINDTLLREAVREYLTFDFNKVNDLFEWFKSEYTASELHDATQMISEVEKMLEA